MSGNRMDKEDGMGQPEDFFLGRQLIEVRMPVKKIAGTCLNAGQYIFSLEAIRIHDG